MNIKERLENEIKNRQEFIAMLATGKPIQMARVGGDEWGDYNGTGYCDDCKYRLKPKPVTPIQRWLIEQLPPSLVLCFSLEQAKAIAKEGETIHHLREVLPDDDTEALRREIADLKATIAAFANNGWRSMKKRSSFKESVIICTDRGIAGEAEYDEGCWRWMSGCKITDKILGWQPIPEPLTEAVK